MEVDVSDYTIEGVLSMKYEDRQQRPIAYLSKSLNKIKKNHKIHDKEMLAVIRELENWKHLLEGAKFKFRVWTDHKNLEYFMKVQKLNRRQAYQTLYLLRFQFYLQKCTRNKNKSGWTQQETRLESGNRKKQ